MQRMSAFVLALAAAGSAAAATAPSLTISLPGQPQATYHGVWPLTKAGQPVKGDTVLVVNVDAQGRAIDVRTEWAEVPTSASAIVAKAACSWHYHPRMVNGHAEGGVAKFPLHFDPARPELLDLASAGDRASGYVDGMVLAVHATLEEAGPPPPPPPPPGTPGYEIARDLPSLTCPAGNA